MFDKEGSWRLIYCGEARLLGEKIEDRWAATPACPPKTNLQEEEPPTDLYEPWKPRNLADQAFLICGG